MNKTVGRYGTHRDATNAVVEDMGQCQIVVEELFVLNLVVGVEACDRLEQKDFSPSRRRTNKRWRRIRSIVTPKNF